MGEKQNHTTARKPGHLYINTLCLNLYSLPPPSSPLPPIAVVGMIKINTEEPLFLTSIVGDGCICRLVVNSGKSKPLLQYIYSYSTTVVLLNECVLRTVYHHIQALVAFFPPYGRVRKLPATHFWRQCTLYFEPSKQLQCHKTIATQHHRVLTPPPL